MQKLAGVKFRGNDKIYYFAFGDLRLKKNDTVIVETERGIQFAEIEIPSLEFDVEKLKKVSSIVRMATSQDISKNNQNLSNALIALKKSREITEKMKLKMQIIDAEYTFDRRQLTFHFLADNRVDFRELVKELATEFKTRIDLRQIGVRDKAAQVGGLGHCGRSLCCATFLNEKDNVSISMAKNQNLALNPNKINGVCGRLLCCLKYEDDQYHDCRKCLPKLNSFVETSQGEGKVINLDILKKKYTVLLRNGEQIVIEDKKHGCC